MSSEDASKPAEPVAGRSAWDFASEILVTLRQVGPTAVVVAGFLFFGYFFYVELTKARQHVDAKLEAERDKAREQLVATYEKMGGMSDKLIKNVSDLLELSAKVDEDVEKSRERLKQVEQIELDAIRREKEILSREIAHGRDRVRDLQEKFEKRQAQLTTTYVRARWTIEETRYALGHFKGMGPKLDEATFDALRTESDKLSRPLSGALRDMISRYEIAAIMIEASEETLAAFGDTLDLIPVPEWAARLEWGPSGAVLAGGNIMVLRDTEGDPPRNRYFDVDAGRFLSEEESKDASW